jgi:hypothetical protein
MRVQYQFPFSASFHDLRVTLETKENTTYTTLFLVRMTDEPIYLGGMALPAYDVNDTDLVIKNVNHVISVTMDSMKFSVKANIK